MAPPPKKSYNEDPVYWSGWVDTPACACPEDCRIAVYYWWYSVRMMSGATNGWFNTGRFLAGIITLGITEMSIHKKNLLHECVVVHYKCTKCQHQFDIQYEIMNLKVGKIMNYGHYKYYEEIQRSGNINHSFAFVKQCFDNMWINYKTLGHNCYHWARDFIAKLSTGNSNSYVYGLYG